MEMKNEYLLLTEPEETEETEESSEVEENEETKEIRIEEIDIYSIMDPAPKYPKGMKPEEVYQKEAARIASIEPYYLDIHNDDPLWMSQRVAPGVKIVVFDLSTKERHEYTVPNNLSKEGLFKSALQSAKTVFAIVKVFEAQEQALVS